MLMKPGLYSSGIFRRQFFALFGTTVVFFVAASLAIISAWVTRSSLGN